MTDQEKIFIESCFEGNLQDIKTCIKYGVNIHVEDDWCINIVARKGYSKLVIFFLENGISHKSASKKMVLAYSCDNEDYILVNFLINQSDEYKNDRSAIQWASAKGNQPIVELLFGYMTNFDGIFCSAARTGQIELLKFLIDNNIHDLDSGSERAVFWAAERYKWDTVKLLIENKIGTIENLGSSYAKKFIEWQREH